jgi:hypothetical protein
MADLGGRLRYLRNAEAMIAVALPAALIAVWADAGQPVAWPLRLGGAALVSALLLQGALYWHLKLAALAAGSGMPPWFAGLYTTLRRLNLVAFAAFAIALAHAASTGTPRTDLGWSAALLGFAVLEHVNYFHVQLMYDTGDAVRSAWRRRGLRPAALGVDLRRARAAGTPDGRRPAG